MPIQFCKLIVITCLVALAAGCSSRESKVRRHLERANQFFAKQEYAKAELEYLNVLRLEAGNGAAVRQLGFVLYEQGRYPQAFAFLQRARSSDKENIEIRSKLGFGALLARNLDQAREEALFILSKQPTNEEALVLLADSTQAANIEETKGILEKHRAPLAGFHVALGLVELRTNEVAAAEANFKEAIRLNPKFATARATLGTLYARQGKLELAEAEFKAAAEAASPRSLQAMSHADFLVKQGRIEDGQKLLEELARRTPDFVPPTIRLAELAFAQRNYDKCESILKSILSTGQANFDALFLDAKLKLARGDAAGAQSEFQRLLSAFPNVAQLHHQLALTHVTKGDDVAASASVNEALRLDPDYPEAILLRAELDVRKGDYASAVGALSLLIKTQPGMTQARLLLAQAHAGRKDFPAAVVEYQNLVAVFPTNAQLQFLLGNLHLQQKDAHAARSAFEQVLALNPNHPGAFERLVDLHIGSGEVDQARDKLQKRLSSAPSAGLYLQLARLHLSQAQTNQAEAAMLKAIETDPNDARSYIVLAQHYVNQKQHQAALERLKVAIAKQPKDIGAHMLSAAIQDELKNFAASREHYEQILAIQPNSAAALNNLAVIYSGDANQRGRALELAKKARALAPNDPAIAHTLGRLALQTRDYPWSLSLLQESARKLPEESEVLMDLAQAQLANGQLADAQASFTKVNSAEAKALADWIGLCGEPSRASAGEVQRTLHADPGHLPARFVSGLLARAGGDPKAAEAAFAGILREYPGFSPANKELAQIYLDALPDEPKALDHALKARQAFSQDRTIAKILGILSYKREDFRRAVELLGESVVGAPDDHEARFYLGMAHLKLGDEAQAREALTKALSVKSDGKFAAAAKETLEELK